MTILDSQENVQYIFRIKGDHPFEVFPGTSSLIFWFLKTELLGVEMGVIFMDMTAFPEGLICYYLD
jgi:hypothetical protein